MLEAVRQHTGDLGIMGMAANQINDTATSNLRSRTLRVRPGKQFPVATCHRGL
jgi:hypothetical protein